MNERYKLNAQLAQMLKGGVIMDVWMLRHRNRRVLWRQQVPALLWRWRRFLQISVLQAA